MAWVPIEGALKKLREARDLTRRELARRSGVKHRTIRAHESNNPPRTMQEDTIRLLSRALNVDKSALAKRVADSELTAAVDLNATDQRMLPRMKTLTLRAEQERGLGKHDKVAVASGEHDLLGAALMRRLSAASALYDGQCFGVVGVIKEYDAIPSVAAQVLNIEAAVGARFMLTRKLLKGSPFYATVFTRTKDQTKTLFDLADDHKKAEVIVRVIVKPPTENWKGFFHFEKRPKPHAFALVVDEIVTAQTLTPSLVVEKTPGKLAEQATA